MSEDDRLKLCRDLVAEADAREGLPVADVLLEAEAAITMLAHDLASQRAEIERLREALNYVVSQTQHLVGLAHVTGTVTKRVAKASKGVSE